MKCLQYKIDRERKINTDLQHCLSMEVASSRGVPLFRLLIYFPFSYNIPSINPARLLYPRREIAQPGQAFLLPVSGRRTPSVGGPPGTDGPDLYAR